MADLSLFVTQNWPLVVIFFCLIIAIFRLEMSSAARELTPQQVTLVINRDNAVLIDIRETEHFKAAHISGSKNLKPDFSEKNSLWRKFEKRKLILVCENGQISAQMIQKVKKAVGHNDIMVLQGGLLAWKQEHLPLRTR